MEGVIFKVDLERPYNPVDLDPGLSVRKERTCSQSDEGIGSRDVLLLPIYKRK